MRLLGSILALSLLLGCAHAAPFRRPQPVLEFTQLSASDSSLEEADDDSNSYDGDDSNVYVTYDEDSDKTRIYVTDEDSEVDEDKDYGTYVDSDTTIVVEDEDSQTMDELVNEYHSSGEDETGEYSISGVEECTDCTSIVVPAGEYREYTEEITTEYDEYYLVRVPVTRYDVYDIVQKPTTTHYVYYKSGDSTIVDQVTACNDCDDEDGSEGDSDSSSSSSSSSESSSSSSESSSSSSESSSSSSESSSSSSESSSESSNSSGGEKEVKETESTSTDETDDEAYSTVDTTNRDSSESQTDESTSSSSSGGSYSYEGDEYCDVDDEVESVSVEEVDEYVVQEVEGGCDHCDLFLQVTDDETYPQLTGDLYDNDQTDESYLTLVSPSEGTSQVTWYEVNDTDEEEYQDDVEDSDNPAIPHTTFMQEIDNALDRDEDDLPDDVDDEEDDAEGGDLYWILVGSFENDKEGSGKVYLVPEDDPEEATVLISGLDKPVGICFDGNYDFLYVVDPTFGSEGYIYQFSIDWDDDDNFNLASEEYVIVYQGANPYSCWVDEFSNLYFVDASDNSINIISYLDLWSGFTNYFYTLYTRDDDHHYINTPVGINVYDSEDLYFINNEVDEESALLNRADAFTAGDNADNIEQKYKGKVGAWGLAVSDDYVHFTTSDNSLWSVDRDDKTETVERIRGLFEDVRGICYGDGDIYVADYAAGKIYDFDDDDDEEDELDAWTAIENPYALYCVNW